MNFLSNLLLVIRTTELEFADYAYCSILVYDVTVNLIVQLMAVSMVPFEMVCLESFWGTETHERHLRTSFVESSSS
uniref:Putative ovule protein n=1 Tax=Solanum chacoense TaxID=4108 RepID=A0A0V0H3Y3_SOLCH